VTTVIVGAGVAGLSAAEALRELGCDGAVRVLGAEAASPYERPALSKRFLDAGEPACPPPLLPPGRLAELGIELAVGVAALAVDRSGRTVVTTTGERVRWDRLLLATGAEPRRLRLPGAELDGVHVLRELADARALRGALRPGARVVVLGGGVVGLEVAAAAAARGLDVTVLEAAPQVMGRVVPDACAALLAALHRARGVRIATGVRAVAFAGSAGCVASVLLAGGERLPADVVVVGVGAVPRTALAERAGLEVRDGIVVDERLRTSDERIFAAGDAAAAWDATVGRHVRREQWDSAVRQGRRAAAAMLGEDLPEPAVPWMWSDQHDLHVQATGHGFDGVEVLVRGRLDARGGVAFLGLRDGRLEAACGVSIGTGVARTIRAARSLVGRDGMADRLADLGVDLHRLARSARSTP
jgi:3-phenylpropionate/trans-cinnamate dioxygenase ferredoxin reductase subunit